LFGARCSLILALFVNINADMIFAEDFPSYLLRLPADPASGTWAELVVVAVTLSVAVTIHVVGIGVTGDVEVTAIAQVD